MSQTECPSADDLARFLVGQSAEAEAKCVESHVAECELCLATLHIMRTQDTLVDAVRGQRGIREPENTAVLELIARLQAQPPSEARPGPGNRTVALSGEDGMQPPSGATLDADGLREIMECLAPARSPDEIGWLGPYRVLRLLGVGGMGVVFHAEDVHLRRSVALKTLRPSVAARAASRKRFDREARAAATIDHPNVIPIFHVDEDRGVPFLAMPLLKGESLDDRIKRVGRMSVQDVLRIGREIAAGLAAAHERGIIHRDIKPANIWLDGKHDQVKILDFGLARATLDSAQLTQQGVVMGTPAFMSPEQINAQTVDARTDLFSLGCVLYRIATGRPAFQGKDTVSTLLAVGASTPERPRQICPEIPESLDELIMQLLAKTPEGRPSSAAAVVEALTAIESDPTQELHLPTRARSTMSGRSKRRRRVVFACVMFFLCAAIIAGGAVAYRMATDRGEIQVVSDDPNAEVVVRKNGAIVDVIHAKRTGKVALRSGDYTVSLAGDAPGLEIVSADTITLGRGDLQNVLVRRKTMKPELLHSIAWIDADQRFPTNIFQTGISPDGKLFFGAGDAGPSGSVRVFEVATGREVQNLRPGVDSWYSNAAFVLGGKYLVAAYSLHKDIVVWDIAANKVVRKLTGHTDTGIGFAASPDGKRLLSWSNDKTLRVWDLDTGKERCRLDGHTDQTSGAFSPDSKRILTYGADKTLRVWDAKTGRLHVKLIGHTDECQGCFSPDGNQVLSYSPDRTIRLWDLHSAKEIRRFNGSRGRDGMAGLVADGKRVVAFCEDMKFHVWDTATGKETQAIDLTDCGGDRWSITASPDGRFGLVNDANSGIRVYDLTTGKEVHRYENCTRARAFSFTPDGQIAVAGSFRAPLSVLRLPQ